MDPCKADVYPESQREDASPRHPDGSGILRLLTRGLGIRPTDHARRAFVTPVGQTTAGMPMTGTPFRTHLLLSLRRQPHGDERCPQRCRTGFRRSAMISGVSTIHHGPCGLDWIPSSRPARHQSITVEMSTFSNSATARVE